MLSFKQGGIKYQFLSVLYDSRKSNRYICMKRVLNALTTEKVWNLKNIWIIDTVSPLFKLYFQQSPHRCWVNGTSIQPIFSHMIWCCSGQFSRMTVRRLWKTRYLTNWFIVSIILIYIYIYTYIYIYVCVCVCVCLCVCVCVCVCVTINQPLKNWIIFKQNCIFSESFTINTNSELFRISLWQSP